MIDTYLKKKQQQNDVVKRERGQDGPRETYWGESEARAG